MQDLTYQDAKNEIDRLRWLLVKIRTVTHDPLVFHIVNEALMIHNTEYKTDIKCPRCGSYVIKDNDHYHCEASGCWWWTSEIEDPTK
jgi:hypothetical protein